MKLVTFEVQTVLGRFNRLGAIAGDIVLDLNACYRWHLKEQGDPQPAVIADTLMPSDMLKFLQNGNRAMETARTLLALYQQSEFIHNEGANGEKLFFKVSEVRLRSPLMNPPSLRDFLAFEVHTQIGFKRRN